MQTHKRSPSLRKKLYSAAPLGDQVCSIIQTHTSSHMLKVNPAIGGDRGRYLHYLH